MICSLGGPLSHGSPVVVFLDRGHPRFWNLYPTNPVDVVRMKSYMNSLFDPARVVIRVTINKLYFVPAWLPENLSIRHQKSSESVDKFPYKYHRKCVGISIENMHTDPMM